VLSDDDGNSPASLIVLSLLRQANGHAIGAAQPGVVVGLSLFLTSS